MRSRFPFDIYWGNGWVGIVLWRRLLTLSGPSDKPLFSERYGHVPVLRLWGGWRFVWARHAKMGGRR